MLLVQSPPLKIVHPLNLKRGRIFILDVWNGLSVLTDPPTQRVKEINNGDERIIHFVMPEVDILAHTVFVNYKILRLKGDRLISETKETHKMRFFYPQEIKYFLEVAGFSDIQFYPFLELDRKLSAKDWNMAVIAK